MAYPSARTFPAAAGVYPSTPSAPREVEITAGPTAVRYLSGPAVSSRWRHLSGPTAVRFMRGPSAPGFVSHAVTAVRYMAGPSAK